MSLNFSRRGLFSLTSKILRCKNIRCASSFEKNVQGEQTLVASDGLVAPLVRHSGSILSNSRTEYKTRYHYQGKLKAVIFDWAGTVIDCGVYAPTFVFNKLFEDEGVPITIEEAREPMGAHKKVHIRKITQMEPVRKRWFEKFGRYPTEDDVNRIYAKSIPMQTAVVSDYAQMIDGAVEVAQHIQQEMKMKIGTTTGYTSEMVTVLKEEAAKQGYKPDAYVAADEVPQARPFPYMVWLNLIRMDVNPIQAVVKVDDTADGVREGITAGCWGVGLARTGNYVGLNKEEIDNLSKNDYERLLQKSYNTLTNSGAHYVIDTVKDLPPVLEDINRRLASGEHP